MDKLALHGYDLSHTSMRNFVKLSLCQGTCRPWLLPVSMVTISGGNKHILFSSRRLNIPATLPATNHPVTTLSATTHPATSLSATTHPVTSLSSTTHPATALSATTHPATNNRALIKNAASTVINILIFAFIRMHLIVSYVCVYLCMRVCVHVCACVFVCVFISSMHVFFSLWVNVSAYLDNCLFMCKFVYVNCVYLCMNVRTCSGVYHVSVCRLKQQLFPFICRQLKTIC